MMVPCRRRISRCAGVWRVAVVRLLGLAPLVIVAALAWRPFYDATYRQLVLPQDQSPPAPHPGRRRGWSSPSPPWLISDAAAPSACAAWS
jgi:hypothetical protein